MSITDELRKYVQSWRETPNLMDELDAGDIDGLLGDFIAIADRIDAEHESACAEAYGNGVESVALPDMTAYVKLPVDADGVPIRVGDVLDGYGKTIEVVELRYGHSGWVLIGRDGNGYADCAAFTHHHEPTVVDTLVEFALACEEAGNAGPEVKRLAAEYAAKLRLAGDAE